MKQIILQIENAELEEKILDEVKKKGSCLEALIIETLENTFLKKHEKEPFFQKLDPLKYISKINFEIDESVDLSKVKPFSDVNDSCAFIKELRKANWER